MRYLFVIILFPVIISSCKTTGKHPENAANDTVVLNVDMHRLPELKTVDSIDMHFFPDVYEQKKYTRYGLNDTGVIRLFILKEINNSFIDNPPCEYDTKFFCFSKGQIIKTLYVAAAGNDTCSFIGYVKSGAVAVRAKLSDSAAGIVNSYRKISISQ